MLGPGELFERVGGAAEEEERVPAEGLCLGLGEGQERVDVGREGDVGRDEARREVLEHGARRRLAVADGEVSEGAQCADGLLQRSSRKQQALCVVQDESVEEEAGVREKARQTRDPLLGNTRVGLVAIVAAKADVEHAE